MHRSTRETVGWSVVANAILFEENEAILETHRRNVPMIVTLGIALVIAIRPAQAENWQLTVKGGEQALGETPIVGEVKTAIPVGVYFLKPSPAVDHVLVDVFRDGDHRFFATILPKVTAGQVTTYFLQRLPNGKEGLYPGISFEPKGSNVIVSWKERLFTEYHIDAGHKPFFFPLVGPTGDSYTRAYPMEAIAGEDRDHPHQHSCWFTFGNVNGIDFWGESKESGKIRESARQMIVAGPVIGRMRTKDEWLAPDGRKILDDERHVTFYTTKARIIDFDIKLEATSGPVAFNDTKEGMFGLRMASTMDVNKKAGGKITNAEGLTDEKAWGQPSPWVDYIGPVHEKTVGIAVLNRPDSFRYPTTWHVRTYGLFAANPFGWHDFGNSMKGDFSLPAGQSISFHYRVILHEGDTKSSGLPHLFAAYATPPGVELKGD